MTNDLVRSDDEERPNIETESESGDSSSSEGSTDTPLATPSPYPFPRPTIGHICSKCQAIPLEILLIGSSFFSKKCKARHSDGECRGKHRITCFHCQKQIQEAHYHCGVCENDNLDICLECIEGGKDCHLEEHDMWKRVFDGKIVREVDPEKEDRYHPTALTQELVQSGLEPYRLHNNVDELLASANAGCHSCSVLVGWLGDQLDDDIPKDMSVFIENRPLNVPHDVRYTASLSAMILKHPILDSLADDGTPKTMVAVRGERDPKNPVFFSDKDRAMRWIPFELREISRTFNSRRAQWISDSGKFFQQGFSPKILMIAQIVYRSLRLLMLATISRS
jgi:hypothetical protein